MPLYRCSLDFPLAETGLDHKQRGIRSFLGAKQLNSRYKTGKREFWERSWFLGVLKEKESLQGPQRPIRNGRVRYDLIPFVDIGTEPQLFLVA